MNTEQTSAVAVNPAYVTPQFDRLQGTICQSPPPDPDQIAVVGINPWDVEHWPNSVIFPHLRQSSATEHHSDSVKSHDSSFPDVKDRNEEANKSPSRFETISDVLLRIKQTRWSRKTTRPEDDIEMADISSSEDTACSNSSTVVDDSSRTLSPATTNSTIYRKEESQSPGTELKLGPAEALDLTTFPATMPEHLQEDLSTNVNTISTAPAVPRFPLPVAHPGPLPNAQHRCSKCNQTFRLPGLLR